MARIPDSILALTREREEMLERYRQELLNVLTTNQQNSVRTRTQVERSGSPKRNIGSGVSGGSSGNKKSKDKGKGQDRGMSPHVPENKTPSNVPLKEGRALPEGGAIVPK
jgi:hypothetical protein